MHIQASDMKKHTYKHDIRRNIHTSSRYEERYIQAAFDTIDSEWGSMDNFISGALSLTEEDILKLKDFYLQ